MDIPVIPPPSGFGIERTDCMKRKYEAPKTKNTAEPAGPDLYKSSVGLLKFAWFFCFFWGGTLNAWCRKGLRASNLSSRHELEAGYNR